jgi:hypothetical protein
MWDAHCFCTGNEFARIPKAYGWFHGKQVNRAGSEANDPSGEVIDAAKFHTENLQGFIIFKFYVNDSKSVGTGHIIFRVRVQPF